MTANFPLSGYGRMAERHWREFLPRMVQELEAQGNLRHALFEAQERTLDEMMELTSRLMAEQGLTHQQAHDQAWETVREKYLLLPPEDEPAA